MGSRCDGMLREREDGLVRGDGLSKGEVGIDWGAQGPSLGRWEKPEMIARLMGIMYSEGSNVKARRYLSVTFK